MQTSGNQNQTVDPAMEKRLSKPLENPDGFTAEDQAFLSQIVSKVESGAINLYTPSSLFNKPVYDKLQPEQRAKAELQAFATLSAIREIIGFTKTYKTPTFQLENLVRKVRQVKEKFETDAGDVFII